MRHPFDGINGSEAPTPEAPAPARKSRRTFIAMVLGGAAALLGLASRSFGFVARPPVGTQALVKGPNGFAQPESGGGWKSPNTKILETGGTPTTHAAPQFEGGGGGWKSPSAKILETGGSPTTHAAPQFESGGPVTYSLAEGGRVPFTLAMNEDGRYR